MSDAQIILDVPKVIQYQSFHKTSEEIVIQVPVIKSGEVVDFAPLLQTITTTTTTASNESYNCMLNGRPVIVHTSNEQPSDAVNILPENIATNGASIMEIPLDGQPLDSVCRFLIFFFFQSNGSWSHVSLN